MSIENRSLEFPTLNINSPFREMKAGHVAIRTTAYTELIQWYQKKLDFKIVHEWTLGEMKFAYIALAGDNHFTIEILGMSESLAVREGLYQGYDHICFEVNDLQRTIEELERRGVSIVRKFEVPSIGKQVAFIADPWGNEIEFSADL